MSEFDQRPLQMDTHRDSAHRVDEIVGEEIRKRRLHLGLTQEQLARVLRVSYQQIQKYETGTTRLSAGRLYEISRLLECDVSTFFERVDAERNGDMGTRVIPEAKTKNTSELIQSYSRLQNSEVQIAILNLIRSLNHARRKS